jgi:hypothetical protein
MEAATASAILAAIAILVSVFGTIRVARSSALIQQWTYRQKVGEELIALSSLLTQSQLLTQREQQRNDMLEREGKRLQLRAADDPTIRSALDAVIESRAVADRKAKVYADARETLARVWQDEKPTAGQLAQVQQMKVSIQQELSKLQDLEPSREDRYKKFMASAALLP